MGPVHVLFLLVPSLLLASPVAQAQTQDAVLDAAGNPLRRGVRYRVVPPFFPGGGGLTMSRVNGSCPPNVVQLAGEVESGEPLVFIPEEPREDGVIRVSDRLYVRFPRPSPCPQSTSTLWQADGDYVTTGGAVSSDDPNDSKFSIFKPTTGRGYVIQSCPCTRCRMACSNVVVNIVNGERLLGVGTDDGAHRVVFRRVQQS